MQRYFVPGSSWAEGNVWIEGEDARHITKVMRMKLGDAVYCCHPDGKTAVCVIKNMEPEKVTLEVSEWLEVSNEMPVHITIAQGIPKGDKFELVLQKGTELGASGFIPYQAARSVAVWDKKKFAKKKPRFEKIVKEASEQSHRSRIPVIYDLHAEEDLIETSRSYDVVVFAYEEAARKADHASLSKLLDNVQSGMRILVCIGPEGGFADEEAVRFKESGMWPVRLGPRILRTETAPLYALASISYHLEELRC